MERFTVHATAFERGEISGASSSRRRESPWREGTSGLRTTRPRRRRVLEGVEQPVPRQ